MAERTKTRNRGQTLVEVAYASKVVLPARRPAIVRRQRLIEALSQSAERRITVVSAPAGYGKTTLLLDFAQSWTDPVCWHAIDERDREIDTFLRYFVACGQQQFPAFGAGLAKALQAGRDLSPEEAVDLMVAAAQAPAKRYLMMLDDFHFLDDAPGPLRQVIDGWLYRLPPNCHVVLSGRTQPQLSVLPLMSVRQEVGTITAADFSFTCEEVAQLFREVLSKEISLDDAQHLADITEGWAAALVLMADKAQVKPGSISLEQLRGSDTLFQYIAVEQFNPLPEDVKQFLTGSAIPRTIEADFVNELLGITDTEEKLNFLARRNLFVYRAEHDPLRCRYHRLFRAFLVSHLRAQDPQRFQDLNLRAAAMRAEAQEWEDAVYHYIQAADWDSIVQVTDKVGWQLFEEGRWETLAEWLEAVPAEEMAGQPRLVLWKARILHYLNEVDRALALLSQAIASFEEKADHLALAEALVTKGMCLRRKGDYAESQEALARASSLLQQHGGPISALTEARKELGITLGQCGEFAKALDELKGALEVYEARGDAYNIAEVSQNIGNALMALGRLPEAAAYLERARQRWTKMGNEERLVQTLNNLGMLYYFLGDYDQAEGVFRSALERLAVKDNLTAEVFYLEVYLHAALGDIHKDRGDYKGALDLYKAALERGGGLEEAYIRIYILDAMANAYRLNGDVTGAQAWAQQASAEAEERGGRFEAGLCRMTLGLIQRDRGQLKEAVASLEQAAALLQEAMAHRELATTQFLLAGVCFSLKRKSLALEFLIKAAAVVKVLGYDHFLHLEASRAPLLIQYAAANKIADGYYAGMLKTLKNARPPAAGEDEGQPDGDAAGDMAVAALFAYGFGNLRVELNGREVTDLEWRKTRPPALSIPTCTACARPSTRRSSPRSPAAISSIRAAASFSMSRITRPPSGQPT
jgi:LuxR family maltose regulon positive regulatory protein